MTGAVVDALEAVEVEAGEGQRAAVAPRQRDRLFQGLEESAPVGEAGEIVGGGYPRDGGVGRCEGCGLDHKLPVEVGQFLFRLLALRDVLALGDGGHRRHAVVGVQGGRVPQHRAYLTVGAQDGNLDDLPVFAGQRPGHESERLGTPLVGGEEQVEMPADDLLCGTPRELLKGAVEARDAPLRVPDDDRCVGVAEEVLKVIARLAELVLGTLAHQCRADVRS